MMTESLISTRWLAEWEEANDDNKLSTEHQVNLVRRVLWLSDAQSQWCLDQMTFISLCIAVFSLRLTVPR